MPTPIAARSVRDERLANLRSLLDLVGPVPTEWASQAAVVQERRLRPIPCQSWEELCEAWDKALRWRQGLEDVLVTMLAVALSTKQQGDQLFLQVIGTPGSAKTRLCSAMLVSDTCYQLENLTGFLSGWKSGSNDSGDYSLLARINGKTLITPEADVIWASKNFQELMAHLRRIFDGSISQDYKTLMEQRRYDGLRTPVIMAGTPKLLKDTGQSRLGDRFIRIVLDSPDEREELEIMSTVASSALDSVCETSNCSPDTQMSKAMTRAYRLTGGYVDWLRENATTLLTRVRVDKAWVGRECSGLADFVAHMRAAPSVPDKWRQEDEEDPFRELPTRLTHQFCRLSRCLAAVTQRAELDDEPMRIIKRIAMDTSRGKSLRLAKMIRDEGADGAYNTSLAGWCHLSEDRMESELRFLKSVGVIENFSHDDQCMDAHYRWRLTRRMDDLWRTVHISAD